MSNEFLGFIRRNQIVVDGIRLNYYEGGAGEDVLFLHGGRLRAITFKDTLEEMSKKYHVIAPDLPGYGLSDTPQTIWSFIEYAHFFVKLIAEMKLQKLTVIGYSFGGGVAYSLATRSSTVKKLILINSAGIGLSNYKEIIKDTKRMLFYFSHPYYLTTLLTLLKEYTLFALKHIRDIDHMSKIRSACTERNYLYKEIHIPVYILWAKDDDFFPLSYAESLHKRIVGSNLVTINGNHDWALYDSGMLQETLNRCQSQPNISAE